MIETIPFNDKMEVIVVDNASTHDEASEIQKRFPLVKIIRSDQNLGFAGGNNLGIKAAKGKFIFLINNDTLFKEFNIQALIDRLESSDTIGMVCPKIRFAWDPQPIQFTGYTELSKITIRNQSIGFGEEDHGQYETAHPDPADVYSRAKPISRNIFNTGQEEKFQTLEGKLLRGGQTTIS